MTVGALEHQYPDVQSNACIARTLTKQDECDADCPTSAAFMAVGAITGGVVLLRASS